MKSHVTLIIIYFILNGVCFTQDIDYDSLITQASRLEEQGRTEDARILLDNLLDQYPEYWFKTSKHLIQLNAGTGKYDENLSIFRRAHSKGLFYFIHPRMPVYKPYSDIPGFTEISENDLRLRDSAVSKSKTIYKIVAPELYDPEKKWPLIFIFHGGGKTSDNAMKHWQASLLDMNFIKVYLQSYRYFDSETYGWGSGDSRLDQEISQIYKEIDDKFNIDHRKIIAGGISAGATAAIDLCLRDIIPATGIIAWCPSIPTFLRNKDYPELKNKNTRVYISAGENDYFLSRQQRMIKLFDSLEVRYKYTIEKNRGHQYPANESSHINDAIKFILDREVLINNKYEEKIGKSINKKLGKGFSFVCGDDNMFYYYDFGRAFNNSNKSPSYNTIYEIGSVSKFFTTYIYSVFINEKRVRQNDRLDKYIPEIANKTAGRIKLKQLAGHTSGLPSMPDNLGNNTDIEHVAAYSESDLISFLNEYEDVTKSTGFVYSNIGTALLGLVLEKASGKPFDMLLEEYIRSDYSLERTFIEVPDSLADEFADGSKMGINAKHCNLYNVFAPTGGLRSTPEDMAIFMSSYLNMDKHKDIRRFMQRVLFRDEISKTAITNGWFLKTVSGKNIYWIAGSTDGFSSFMGYCLYNKRFAIILSNSNIGLIEAGFSLLTE